jgi:hypothetical protein
MVEFLAALHDYPITAILFGVFLVVVTALVADGLKSMK